MRKALMIAAALIAVAPATANASGWTAYYDCGNGVVPIFGGWHGKKWMGGVEENHKTILEGDGDLGTLFQDFGIDSQDDNPQKLDADKTVFDFPVKWRGKTVILRWRNGNDGEEVTFDGKVCRNMGDGRYDDTEAGRYVKEGEKK